MKFKDIALKITLPEKLIRLDGPAITRERLRRMYAIPGHKIVEIIHLIAKKWGTCIVKNPSKLKLPEYINSIYVTYNQPGIGAKLQDVDMDTASRMIWKSYKTLASGPKFGWATDVWLGYLPHIKDLFKCKGIILFHIGAEAVNMQGNTESRHSTILIIDNSSRIFEFWNPHGWNPSIDIPGGVSTLVALGRLLGEISGHSDWRVINPINFSIIPFDVELIPKLLAGGRVGPQYLEREDVSAPGYCALWTMMYTIIRLSNPKVNPCFINALLMDVAATLGSSKFIQNAADVLSEIIKDYGIDDPYINTNAIEPGTKKVSKR